MKLDYDVIVVGAGHAGCEAAAAAANLGSKTLLITMNMQTIGQMSCNPAMGGVAKGQIVREIDALGGLSGIVTDKTMIQFRILNRSKGAAMWSPRSQNDRLMFANEWRMQLEQTPNLDFWQETVKELIVKNNQVVGVKTAMGMEFKAKCVVLTNGTFLNGLIHIGEKKIGGGRAGESAAFGITEQLILLGFEAGRMKTGTPPRIDGRTINYTEMEEQHGDEMPGKFSFTSTTPLNKQKCCWITYTNQQVHEALKVGFDRSPMFTGRIQGLGPRYCPSIEDKIERFADKERHQLFVEPEGWNTVEVYLNGFSTSLPQEVQYKALQLIPGFKHAKMFRPGYAIEYDYFPPVQLSHTLETKLISGLFFAGQINGTTGYEEAACQGLMAGINAHLKATEQNPFILHRSDAYIGVLIDDLITKGTEEPYRMFTSRAEFRILLRQDNADIRLTPIGNKLGLASNNRLKRVNDKIQNTLKIIEFLEQQNIDPEEIDQVLIDKQSTALKQRTKLINILLRPQIELNDFMKIKKVNKFLTQFDTETIEQAEVSIKYNSYVEKEKELVEKMSRLENISINPNFNYHELVSLSKEAREKLTKIKPNTLGQATRISGVSPSDISVLLIKMGR